MTTASLHQSQSAYVSRNVTRSTPSSSADVRIDWTLSQTMELFLTAMSLVYCAY